MAAKRKSTEHVVVLGDGLEQRTNTKSGNVRFTVKVDPVAINLHPLMLGQPIAEAIAHTLREKMRGISATASPATIRAREAARRALMRGEQWAYKRYSGGRTGTRVPAQTDKLFQDSMRFIEGIVARASKIGTNDTAGVWRINVPGNRLDPNTATGGAAAVQKIYARLLELVPEFADMSKLMATSDVLKAKVRAQEKMVRKGTLRELAGLATDVLDLVRRFTG